MTTTEILTGIKTWVLNKLSLKQDVINDLAAIRSGSQAGSTAVQPSDLSSYFNNASYDTSTHRINFYHGQNIVAYVDASPFIVDGMVDDVRIENGFLVIDFNIASGKQDISIPLADIFDPSNYYNKEQTNTLLGNKVDKVQGKGLSTNDYTNAEKEKLSGLQNYDDTQVRQLIGQKQDIIQDLEDIRSGASAGASAVQPSTLNSALSDTVAESGVYDVTANNNNAKFASLSALLGSENLDTLIPSAKRKGGMSVKFVLSSDNKYVQFRYMPDDAATVSKFMNAANWQGVDDEPTAGSENLISSMAAANIAFRLGTDKVVVPLRNGSPGNGNNANAVCPAFIIKKVSKYARIITDRPIGSGYVYLFGLITYSISKGEVIANEQYKVRDLLVDLTQWRNNIILNDNELGFAFSLYQYDMTNQVYEPLRVSDFQSYNVYVEFTDSLGNFVDSDKTMQNDVLNYKYINLDLRDGTPTNPNNINAVACPFIVDARKFKKGRIITNRPASAGYVYNYIVATNTVYEGDPTTAANQIRHYEQVNSDEFILENGEIGVSIGLCEITNDQNYVYHPLRKADFNGYYIGLLLYNDSAIVNVVDSLSNSLEGSLPETHIVPSNQFRNGSPGNKNNQYAVSCGSIVNVSGFDAFEIFTNRPVTEGCEYAYCYNFYDVINDDSRKHENDGHKKIDKATPTANQKIIYNLPYNGIAFGIYEIDRETSEYHPLRIEDFSGYKVGYKLYKGKKLSELIGFTRFLNKYNVEENLFQLNRKSGDYASSNASLNQCLTLLQITDVHGSVPFIERVKLFREEYKEYITDIINTGDIIESTIYNGSPINQVSDIGKHILTVIGNHDSEHADDDYSITAQTCYETFIEDYINYWDCTSPGVNKCYYYKDYSDFGIRLIILDCMHYDSDQDTWLENILTSARQSNLSVIAASHCPPSVGVDKINSSFTSVVYSINSATKERLAESAFQKVDDFISNGGEFICWIMGHTHHNIIGKVRGYDAQLVFIMENSNHNSDFYLDYYNDSNRVRNSNTEDAVNIISFDKSSKIVKVFRIGHQYDRYLRSHKAIVVNYETGEILLER